MVYHQPGPVCEDSGRTSEKEAPQDADDHLCKDQPERRYGMPDKLYIRLLVLITVIGLLLCIGYTVYTVEEYLNCSIIAFIANEWWPK